MNRTYIISFIFLVFGATVTLAQPYKESAYDAKLELADELFLEGHYLDAMDLYRDCYSESRDPSLLSTMAEIEYIIRDYKRAKRSFERIFRRAKKELYPELVFVYARILKMDGDYNEAYRHFNIVIENSENDSLNTLAANEIEGMRIASDFEPRYDLYVESLPKEVNTAFSDLGPAEGPDGKLYFTTFSRNTFIPLEETERDDKNKYATIQTTQKDKEGAWGKAVKLKEEINQDGYHIGNPAFSADGQEMFFTRSQLSGREVIISEIVLSTFDGTDWSAPEALSGVNGEFPALQPCPGELYGKEVLFFVSKRPGGMGGYDLYYAERQGGTSYGLPINLGETVNSIGDEFTPYYANGTLYFSSDGHPTMGGKDVFFSTWDGSKWSKPENMGSGYNSRYDDIYFKTNIETDKGFLVSNRPNDEIRSLRSETCCDDIYSVGIKDIEVDVLTTIFADQKPLLGATIEVAEINKNGDVISANSVTGEKGNTFKFRLQADKLYRVFVSKDGYVTDSSDINTEGIEKSYSFKRQFELERAEPETEIVTINQPIRLSNIYYDYDDDKILPSAEGDLNQLKDLLDQYPDMVIELSSHTDARGNDAYNEDLSQRRANSAKRYLVQGGVEESRIVAKGYGERKILNKCRNGVPCSEEDHRLNRRTEFKILEGPKTIEIKKEVIKGTKREKKGKLNVGDETYPNKN
jgi:peptidoglycan-associated lipoprotein